MAADFRIEAVFLATSRPDELGRFLHEAVGLSCPVKSADGQLGFDGLGTYLAIEPTDAVTPDGAVTLWLRASNVPAVVASMVEHGGNVIMEPTAGGEEQVAVVVSPQGQRIGVIGARHPQ